MISDAHLQAIRAELAHTQAERDRLKAENERLRAALEHIETMAAQTLKTLKNENDLSAVLTEAYDGLVDIQHRAALRGEGGEDGSTTTPEV